MIIRLLAKDCQQFWARWITLKSWHRRRMMNGLFDAHWSMAPVLAIAAHIPSGEIGTSYFQETHPDRLFAECSHFSELISNSGQMPRTFQIAMQNAIGKQGVAVVAVSGDIAARPMPDGALSHPPIKEPLTGATP